MNRLVDTCGALTGLIRRIAPVAGDLSALDRAERAARLAPRGTDLVVMGEPCRSPLVLQDGWAMHQQVLPDGRSQIVEFLFPGDIIGRDAGLRGIASSTVTTLTDVAVSAVDDRLLAELAEDDVEIGFALACLAARGEALLRERIVSLGRRTAYERVAHLLLEIYLRLAFADKAGHGRFELPATQEILSDALGMSRVHTNRVLQQLRRERLLKNERPHDIVIADLAALQSAAAVADGYVRTVLCQVFDAPRRPPPPARPRSFVTTGRREP